MAERERCGRIMPRSGVKCMAPKGHESGCYVDYEQQLKGQRERKRVRYQTPHGRAVALVHHAQRRARERGLPFNLTVEWAEGELDKVLADGCPLLDIPIILDGDGKCANSPSIDQRIPGVGYTRENCGIVSWRANELKRNGSLDELLRMAENLPAWMVST